MRAVVAMDSKTLQVLEYPKILERLASFCDFSASAERARALQPVADLGEARRLLAETSEARLLLSLQELGIGGARDIRPAVDLAARGGVLTPSQLLELRSTLMACRQLKKAFERLEEKAPLLAQIAAGLPDTYGLVDAIHRTLSDGGEVLDGASEKLARVRGEARAARERLMARLQKYLTEQGDKFQEAIITQRDGRYVLPLRVEFKGQIKAIVHDQSASGATLFIEPLSVVELNNEIRALEIAERDEIHRILAELSTQVGQHRQALVSGMEHLAALDLAFAKAKYAEALRASEPILLEATSTSPTLNLLRARHPLLDPATVVPIDFSLPEGAHAVVITGPNTGGKTVALKTVGLLVLMAQSGLHIPAQSGSELSFFHEVYADIGDEQSIEQSLSTFSSHIMNIVRILQAADSGALVILDELGAGTDPQEGAALARALLAHLLERGLTTLVTTHHPELKTFAHVTPGVVNASVEFDLKTLRPTYQLTIGLPGRSNALAIARRLGLDEKILAAARSEIHPDDRRADKLLDDIRRERNRLSREREKLEKARLQLEEKKRELERRLAGLEQERRAVLARARAEGELEVAIFRQNLEALKQQLKKAGQSLPALREVESQVEALQRKAEAPPQGTPIPALSIEPGAKVYLASLRAEGVVTALGEEEVEVQIGSLRVRAQRSDLRPAPAGNEHREEAPTPRRQDEPFPILPAGPSPGWEISLRGKRVEDGLSELERYLEQAYAAGLPFVRIVHGKGTGRMRQAVRAALKESPYVQSFEEAGESEGGAGATIARLMR